MAGSLSNTSVVQSNYKTQPGKAIRKSNGTCIRIKVKVIAVFVADLIKAWTAAEVTDGDAAMTTKG